MENTGLASALPIQIGASIGFGLAQDWLIGPNWHALATPQRGMPIHVNPVQSANPRPIQNTAETVRPPDWHGLADWIFKKGEYFTRLIDDLMYTRLIDDLIDVYLVDITNCDTREDQIREWSGAVGD